MAHAIAVTETGLSGFRKIWRSWRKWRLWRSWQQPNTTTCTTDRTFISVKNHASVITTPSHRNNSENRPRRHHNRVLATQQPKDADKNQAHQRNSHYRHKEAESATTSTLDQNNSEHHLYFTKYFKVTTQRALQGIQRLHLNHFTKDSKNPTHLPEQIYSSTLTSTTRSRTTTTRKASLHHQINSEQLETSSNLFIAILKGRGKVIQPVQNNKI